MFKIYVSAKECGTGNAFFYEFHGEYQSKDEAKKDIVIAIMAISRRHKNKDDEVIAMIREVKHG